MKPTLQKGLTVLSLGAALVALPLTHAAGRDRDDNVRENRAQVVATDNYIYYPASEVYYNTTRQEYVYRKGRHWVTRREAPSGWVQTAPSVTMDFHDTPEHHHAEVIRMYPKTWVQERREEHAEHVRDDDRRDVNTRDSDRHDDRR